MTRSLLLLLLSLVTTGAATGSEPVGKPPSEAGIALADRLLAAMGGRDAWAEVAFVHVEARHDDLDIREPFLNRIWNDFSEPRVRFWAGNDEFTSGRRIGGGRGVREVGPLKGTPLTADQYESDRSWWEGNVYRTLHRMARRDKDLGFRAASAARLEVLKADGSVLNWFVLNQKGEPMLFGSGRDERGTAFGPLASTGRVKYPKWGARADGSWRYEILKLVVEASVPRGLFPEHEPE